MAWLHQLVRRTEPSPPLPISKDAEKAEVLRRQELMAAKLRVMKRNG